MFFEELYPYIIALTTLPALFSMVAGVAVTRASDDNVVFAFGVFHTVVSSMMFLILLSVMVLEIGIRYIVEPLGGTRAYVVVPRNWSRYFKGLFRRLLNRVLRRGDDSIEMDDLERGPDLSPRYPWNRNGAPTVGFRYPEPRVIVTETGLPNDWDRPDNVGPIRRALAEMRSEGRIRATREDTHDQPRESRGTQTSKRNRRRVPRDERMPRNTTSIRFWSFMLEEQWKREQGRIQRVNRRWSS